MQTTFTILSLDHALLQEAHELSPEQKVERQERFTFLRQALDHLTPFQLQLIHLRYHQELRLLEIGAILGRSEGAVRKLLARTIRQLRVSYAQHERGHIHETI